MLIPIYQIDAFTSNLYRGNPAAVCPLDHWMETHLLQGIAQENNLSETAFFVSNGDVYDLRWFTPCSEVKLCGHATLATAFVIFNYIDQNRELISFNTASGLLEVFRDSNNLIHMNFPSQPGQQIDVTNNITKGLRERPEYLYLGEDLMAVFSKESQIHTIAPNFSILSTFPGRGVIITAAGDAVDFVSRFFAPKVGILEDPVTGSAHCMMAPYWSQRLKRKKLLAKQLSKRGGDIACELKENRVQISGKAIKFLVGKIHL